ncbi:hypothetical protein [Streptomyces sp. 2323.1]|uniref:hypothetical protein n=1 Tax=Streptomyces sp. 2323.1 TaxID=1938841 RepID=UPI0013312BEF|nr:hypothetical protein [Streptomyces sp. 2323.1]
MGRRATLNDRQLTVLRRICEDSTPVTSAESALAATVYALRRRGLVTTAWADGRWTAAPTEAGRRTLAEADGTVTASDPSSEETAAGVVSEPPTPEVTPEAAARLIADIERSGGSLRIRDPAPEERARMRRVLHAAKATYQIPGSHHLEYSGRDKGDLVIRLVAGEHPRRAPTPTEPVTIEKALLPEQLHSVVRQAAVPVCGDCRERARRILQAVCSAAERKGFAISNAAPESRAVLSIGARSSAFPVVLTEGSIEVHDPEGVQYAWQRVTARAIRPSHELEIGLAYDWAHRGRRYRWGDRRRWRLEDKLPDLLREVDRRSQIDEERQLAQQRKAEETERRWHEAMDRARTAFIHAHRQKALHDQVEAWNEASRIRAYCDALEQHLQQAPTDGEARAEAVRDWLSWARDYAAHIDPVPRWPGIPEDPDISPSDLRPYLEGWSPYEPKRAR